MTQTQIALAFSEGQFELTFPYLADNLEWIIIDDNHFIGKEAVIQHCEKVSDYFNSVRTDFRTLHVIQDGNKIAINGTAEFFKDDQRVSYVSACDIYLFNSNGKLEKITSYCIEEK